MKPIPTTLTHRVLMPEHPSAERHPLLVMIHGRGADEEDLLGLAPMLDPRLILLSVRAPLPFEGGGYTWYTLAGPIGQPERTSFLSSFQALDRFLRDVVSGYPVDPSRVFLFGFSMGAVMSLTLALTQPAAFRGIVAHSGYIPEGAPVDYQRDLSAGPPLFVAHGSDDQVIPVAMARRARMHLEGVQAHLTYREYPMGHQISDESLADILAWMRGLLDNAPATSRP